MPGPGWSIGRWPSCSSSAARSAGLLGTRLAHHLAGYKHALTLTFSGIVIAVGLYVIVKSIIG